MSEPESSSDALRRALGALRDMKERLDRAEGAAHEPIALIGAGCRFPGGADSTAAYWELLRSGTDAVGSVPADRWDNAELYDPDPDAPGKLYTDQGGFVDWPVDRFDAGFFGISPREASSLDPQQRLLLEVAWEAFENAGVAPDGLAGSSTGVFIGLGTSDYANMQVRGGDSADIGTYFGTGVAPCVAAGRISYLLGLRGPSLALDTACSSSLVAIALAVQSLRTGACRAALAGGINLMLDPQPSIFLSRFRALSPTGRCHTFGADADGYVRGEGCGLVVLKRLSDAQADGDRIMAVIRGAAINNDGRSSGLTVPSGTAQRLVMEQALADARLAPEDVELVEAHGTGTELGDPIEVRALEMVYGRSRSMDSPLLIGSAKTNVGHLEAAAGVAGVLKLVLALQHEEIPPHLHCDEPSPHIDWASLPIVVTTEGARWPRTERPRRGAVSAFGFSGTNAHLIIEEAPGAAPEPAPPELLSEPSVEVLTLSAKDEPALRALAARFADHLEGAPSPMGDLAWTTQTGRALFPHRLAAVARSSGEAAARLRSWMAGDEPAGVVRGEAPASPPPIAFVFTGQGAQHPLMGRDLYRRDTVFRSAMDDCDKLLRPHLSRPLLDVLYSDDDQLAALVHQTAYTQPAIFAVEYSLVQLWRSWGIEPSAVAGHSIGEYVAACVAGVLSLEDALLLIAARGRLMGDLPAGGAMVAIFEDEEPIRELIAPFGGRVGLAACNGPSNVVVSGEGPAIDAVVDSLVAAGIGHRRLQVSHAFHSPLMAPMLAQFSALAAAVEYREPTLPFVSAVTGSTESAAIATSDYWVDHVAATVRFGDAAATLVASGMTQFLEIGPRPTILGMLARLDGASGLHASLRPGRNDGEQVAEALAGLWAEGLEPDWAGVHDDRRARVEAPTYPFQRRRHWFTSSAKRLEPRRATIHPLLDRAVESPAISGHVYEAQLGADDPAYLDDHRVFDTPLVPATGFLEMALAAGAHAHGGPSVTLEQVTLREMLVLPEGVRRQVQVTLGDPDEGVAEFGVHSSVEGRWRVHATGRVRFLPVAVPADRFDLDARRSGAAGTMEAAAYYDQMASGGITYGAQFRTITELSWGENWALGRLALPSGQRSDSDGYAVHPALLDGALQLMGAALMLEAADDEQVFVPVGVGSYHVVRPAGAEVWALVQAGPVPSGNGVLSADVELFDREGQAVASLRGVKLRPVDPQRVREQVMQARGSGEEAEGHDGWLYELAWTLRPLPTCDPPRSGSWLILADDTAGSAAIAAELAARGHRGVVVRGGSRLARLGEQGWVADTTTSAGVEALLEAVGTPLGGWSGVVLDAAVPLDEDASEADTQHTTLNALVAATQALAGAEGMLADDGRLWLLTRGAQSVNEQADPVALPQAPLWGLASAIGLEEPALRIACIDLPPRGTDYANLVVDDLLSGSDEDRIAYRGDQRYGARLRRLQREQALPVPTGGYALAVTERGTIDALVLEPVDAPRPAAGDVVIAVRASGLNFRDVLSVLGMYPGPVGAVGTECAGEVVAVGEGVEGLDVGDAVVALVDGAFVRHALAPAHMVFKVPNTIDFSAAATIPVAFLTAHYGLEDLAGISQGDVVLVHAAAGGVGMAAVQIARRAGATVIGTAGSPEKRSLLRSLGVEEVYDSRSLDFAAQVMAVTDGRGVDIALNSLSDEFIEATLGVVADGGVFLEIGKRGIWSAAEVAERYPGVRYHVYDLAEIIVADPEHLAVMMQTILSRVADGTLSPLPRRLFPIDEVRAAFRFMAMARHVGKVVVTHARLDPSSLEPGQQFPHDASYLVTGGLGGLGLEAASGLVRRGARHVVLMSRGQPSPDAQRRIDELRAAGADVVTVQADVGQREQVEQVLLAVRETMPPLRGVVHAAGTVDDGLVRNLDWSRFESVLRPKVAGARHLHELTAGDRLDFFVMYSSASSLLGSAGQGNYAAANAYLDAMAHHRRALGLPGLSINWGGWAEVGMAAGLDQRTKARWSELGMRLISPREGDAVLMALLQSSPAQIAVLPVDWERMARQLGTATVRPFLERVLSPATHDDRGTAVRTGAFSDGLRGLDADERLELVRDHVARSIVAVLGLDSSADLDDDRGLPDLGMDSLMAVELSNRLQRTMEIRLDSTAAFEWPTLDALSRYIAVELVGAPEPDANRPAAAAETEAAAAQRATVTALQGISEEEAERSLLAALERSGY